ncbi:MAG: LamG domain-containing protein, partial [Planctomycetota bacterium]
MYKKPILLICFVLVLGLVPASAAKADLAGWWRLDETSGTIASDSSLNGNDGTLVGDPQWVPGQIAGALDFDGDDWVDCGLAPPELVINGAITIACWINPAVLSGNQGLVGLDGGYTFKTLGTGLRFTTPGILDHSTTNTTLVVGAWQHVAATFQPGQAEGLIFYLHGSETERMTSSAMNAGTGTFRIAWNQFGGETFTGLIDDARVYDNILSEAEIEEIMLGDDIWNARNPDPAHLAVDVPIDANLTWTRGDGALWDYVYFGTDPCDMNLPQVDTLQVGVDDPLYDPPGDLIPSTTYYWYITEVNAPNEYPGPLWSFSTIPGEATPKDPLDGEEIEGEDYPDDPPYTHIWTMLIFNPGPTAVKHTGYFSDDYSKVYTRHQDANLGSPPYPFPGWEYIYFAGNPEVGTATDTLVRGKTYY